MIVLKKHSDYLATAKGMQIRRSAFVLQARQSVCSTIIEESKRKSQIRIGFTVTKKVGTAPVRSRIKRRLKAAWQETESSVALPGFDYVLIGRKYAVRIPFEILVAELKNALKITAKNHYQLNS